MQFPTRTLIVNLALIALFLVAFVPIFLFDPLSDETPLFLLPLPVAAYPGLFLAVWALVDSSFRRGEAMALRIASGLAGVAHGIGWGSWVLLLTFPEENPINITGVIGPGLGCVLSIAAVIVALSHRKPTR